MSLKKFLAVNDLPASVDAGFLILRLVVGIAFVLHGWGKIQNPMAWAGPDNKIPGFLQLLAAVSEFGGGIALAIGLLTRLGSLGIAITMTVAVLMHSLVLKQPFVDSAGGGAFELPATYFAVALLFVLAGPGKLSLDRKIFGLR